MKNKKIFWMVIGAIIYAVAASLIEMSNTQIHEQFNTMNTMIRMEKVQNELSEYNKFCGAYPISFSELNNPKNCSSYRASTLSVNQYNDYMGIPFNYAVSGTSYTIKSSALSWIEGSSSEKAYLRKLDPDRK